MSFNRRNIPLSADAKEEISGAKNIFEVFYSMSRETPPGAYPLNTGEWIRGCQTLYPEFYAKALEYQPKGYIRVVSNDAYEAELASTGQCGAFVISDGDIRLPKITRYIRGYESEQAINVHNQVYPSGLPNITGNVNNILKYKGGTLGGTGALYDSGSTYMHSLHEHASATFYVRPINIDASRSNGVYGRYASDAFGFSNEVVAPCVTMSLYIQVFNHAPMAGYVNGDVQEILDTIRNYTNQMDQKYQNLLGRISGVPDITRKRQITLNLPPSSTNIKNNPNRQVILVRQPCWYMYWCYTKSDVDSTDADQMIQWSSQIQYVSSMTSSQSNDTGGTFLSMLATLKSKDSTYDALQQFNAKYLLIPLVPGMYYDLSLGNIKSDNEKLTYNDRSYLLPIYNSATEVLAEIYSVQVQWNSRSTPLTYISHSHTGSIYS